MIRNGENFKGVETRHIRASGDTWNEKTDVKALLQTLLNRLYNRTSVEAEMTSATARQHIIIASRSHPGPRVGSSYGMRRTSNFQLDMWVSMLALVHDKKKALFQPANASGC